MSGLSVGSRRWLEMAIFVVFGLLSIGIPLIPMGLAANSIAFPDIMYAVFAAWVIRRPMSAPTIGIAFFGVLADAFMMRPMGLWALMLFVGMEVLRISERAFRDIPFVVEWLYVSILFAVLLLLQNVFLVVSFDSAYGFITVLWHWVKTVAVYPVVVMIIHWVAHIRAQKIDKRPNRLGYVL